MKIKIFLITFVISLSMVLAGCPTANAVTKAAQGADKLPGLADAVITAADQGYNLGAFGIVGSKQAVDAKDAFVKDCQPVIDAGRAFDAAVVLAKNANDTSAATISKLSVLFNNVVTATLKVGEDLKVLPADKAAQIIQTVTAVTKVALQIAAVFLQAGYHSPEMEVLNERYA